jgi:hypothetical protein
LKSATLFSRKRWAACKKTVMRTSRFIILIVLIISSCRDFSYIDLKKFYSDYRFDFIKSDLTRIGYNSRFGFFRTDKNGFFYSVIFRDTNEIIINGLSKLRKDYNITNDSIIKNENVRFKLINGNWISLNDSTFLLKHFNFDILDYFRGLELLRIKWHISMIHIYDSTITLRFYNNKEELIYKDSGLKDLNTKKIEKLDSLWTLKKLKKSYDN